MTVSLEEEPELQTRYSTSLNSLLDQILNCTPKDFAFFRNSILIWTSFRLAGYMLKMIWEKELSSHALLSTFTSEHSGTWGSVVILLGSSNIFKG